MTKLFALIGICVALASLPAWAQDTQAEYQSFVEKGLREFELGNYSEARVFFQHAHQLSPNARTLRSLGMTSYEIRHYVEAQDYLQQALASNTRPLTPQMREEVTQILSQARSFVTRLQLQVMPADAQVRIDTHEVYRDSDGTILLDPGTHELSVEARGYDATTRSIRNEGSESLDLTIRLQKIAAANVNLATATQAANNGAGPYILIAGSGAVAVAGGTLLAIALSNKHAVEHPEPTADGPRFADYEAKASSVAPLSAAGIIALSAGGLGMAAGLVWKLTSHTPAPEKNPGPSLAWTPMGVSLTGRY